MSESSDDRVYDYAKVQRERIASIKHLLESEKIQFSESITILEKEVDEAQRVMVHLMGFLTPEQKQHGLTLAVKNSYYRQYQALQDNRENKKKSEIVSAQHAIRCQTERTKQIKVLGGIPSEAFLEEEKQLKQNLADLEISDPMKTDLY